MDQRVAELREDLYTLIKQTKRPKRAFSTSWDEEHNAIVIRTFKGAPDSLRPDLLDEAMEKNVHLYLTSDGFAYYFPGILLRILDILETDDEEKARPYAFPLKLLFFDKAPWKVLDHPHRLIALDIWDLGERQMPNAFWTHSRDRA